MTLKIDFLISHCSIKCELTGTITAFVFSQQIMLMLSNADLEIFQFFFQTIINLKIERIKMSPQSKLLSAMSIVVITSCYATQVSATIIDNSWYTTDTTSGLEWLDSSYTNGLTYNDVTARLGVVGDSLYGWRYANVTDLNELISNFTGSSITGTSGATFSLGLLVPLIDMIGATYSGSVLIIDGLLGDVSNAGHFSAQLSSYTAYPQYGDSYVPQAFNVPDSLAIGASSFLVRNISTVPEPASLALLGLGLFGLVASRRFGINL